MERVVDIMLIDEADMPAAIETAGDLLGYCQKWLAFQKRFAEVLPAIPVYSNNYTDVYTDRLQGYDITANPSWGLAVVGAQLGDPVTVQPAEEN